MIITLEASLEVLSDFYICVAYDEAEISPHCCNWVIPISRNFLCTASGAELCALPTVIGFCAGLRIFFSHVAPRPCM